MKQKAKGRRGNNEGSIIQRKNGIWCGVITIGRDSEGKRIRKFLYGKSEKDVAFKMREISAKAGVLNVDTFQKKFCELFEEWLFVFKKTEVTSRTFSTCINNYNLHIKPYLQNMSIEEIDVLTLKKMLNRIDHKTPRRKCKFLLNQFYDYAVEERMVQTNPVLSIKLKDSNKFKDNTKLEYKAISPENRKLFFEALEDNPFLKMLCLTSYYSGLRIGEVLALQWRNVDFDNKTISVEHTITCEFEFDNDGNVISKKTVLASPKTNRSKAKLPMSDALYEVLKKQKEIQDEIGKKRNLILTNKDNLVFCNKDGSIRSYNTTRLSFEWFLKSHDLKSAGIHFHSLRHTFATILKENHFSIYDIQNLLRHTRATTTEIYLSNDAESALGLKKDLNNIFSKRNNEQEASENDNEGFDM